MSSQVELFQRPYSSQVESQILLESSRVSQNFARVTSSHAFLQIKKSINNNLAIKMIAQNISIVHYINYNKLGHLKLMLFGAIISNKFLHLPDVVRWA